jgi:Copper transport outer membrane protein, MctB
MGYSGRYHAASLAAVFLALAIGILIGVGLGHNVIPAAQKDLEQSLKSDLSAARGRSDSLQSQLNQQKVFGQEAYPGLVGGQLRGDRIAVVALGALPDEMKGNIEAVVGPSSPTGATLGEVAVVREPPDLQALSSAAPPASPVSRLTHNTDALPDLGRRIGRALVLGGSPLNRFGGSALARISGRPGRIDGVIVVRSQPTDMNQNQAAATSALESGVLAGLQRTGSTPVVGVERSDADDSSIGYFESEGVTATVDSIDFISGQVALTYALAGVHGNYGVKSSADRLLPTLRHPAPASATPAAP